MSIKKPPKLRGRSSLVFELESEPLGHYRVYGQAEERGGGAVAEFLDLPDGGLVEQVATPAALAAARMTRPSSDGTQPAPPMRGLFKRILGKLLGARLGEAATG